MSDRTNAVTISINLRTGWCRVGNRRAKLGNRERQLFAVLLANMGKMLTKDQIVMMVWGRKMGESRVAEVVRQIRMRLGDDCICSPKNTSKLHGYWMPSGNADDPTEVATNPVNPLLHLV